MQKVDGSYEFMRFEEKHKQTTTEYQRNTLILTHEYIDI